ncbi:PQQ-binding-like beta-propeller repeat protein [Catenuloplanes sp. NPDC051500]|uniref:outer membrane protein assembly factor BamB family protein n=1 Tax=Catenuloplanes sp. NPDC051500 TaxID=3363959 RepID=UPI00379A2217
MTVSIDLGVISDEQPAPPSSRPGPGIWRTVASAAALLLAGGLLGASGAPVHERPVEARVPMGPHDALFVAGDTLYVVGPEADSYTTLPRTITAFTVPGGERQWQHPLDTSAPVMWLTAAGDVLLATTGARPDDQKVVALDSRTAKPLWERAGASPQLIDDDSVLFVAEPGVDSAPVVWERVRTSTGERLWRREFPPATSSQPMNVWDTGDQRMLATLPGGRTEIWDTATNRMLSTADLSLETPLSVFETVGLASDATATGTTLIGYSMPDLRKTWTREFGSIVDIVGRCGAGLVCLRTGEPAVVSALDPATGDVLWENRTYEYFEQWGPVLLTDGRWSPDQRDGLAAVDPRTGQTLRDFGPWTLARYEPEPDPAYTVVTSVDAERTAVLVAELDLRALTLRVIGQVDAVKDSCHAEGTVLFCRTPDGAALMRRLPVTS